MTPSDGDYLWRAPEWVERGGEWWALLGFFLIVTAVCLLRIRGPRWRYRGLPLLGVVGAAFGIGAAGGAAARPVNGANIGGGIALGVGLPVLAIILLVSLATVVRREQLARPQSARL